MPVFSTPEPISVVLDLPVGDVRITASERSETVVEVRSTSRHDDVFGQAAAEAHVELTEGTLVIRVPTPRRRGMRDMLRPGNIEVAIEVPVGSHVRETKAAGGFHGVGRLGQCRLHRDYGNVRLEETGPLEVTTSSGTIKVDRAVGPVEITSQHGGIDVRSIDGPATIRNTNGGIALGEVTGDLCVTGVNGNISVGRALGNVEARTAHGRVRVREVVQGSVRLTTATGRLDVGIAPGTAAWLELESASGRVHNHLASAEGPGPSERTVEVRARTSHGDIHIRRAREETFDDR